MLTKIPHPKLYPILRNLPHINIKKPLESTIEVSRQYYPIMELHYPGATNIVVTSCGLAKEVMNEELFVKDINFILQSLRDSLVGDGLFTAYPNEKSWGKAHRILMPAFGHSAMKNFHPKMLDAASHLLAKWHNLPEENFFCLTNDMIRLTFETIGLCGFDYRFNSFGSDKPHPFVSSLLYSFTETMESSFLPGFLKKLRFLKSSRLKKEVKQMNDLVDELITQRKENLEKYQDKNDLLNLMLLAKDPETGEKLDLLNIRYQILTFLIAGHETTSGLLSFAFYFLLKNPDILKKAYQEVDTKLGTDLGKMPTFEEVNRLKYIQQILFESLRLYPTAPAFGVHPIKDTVIGGKYFIKKGQTVLVLLSLLHRDKAVWGNNPDEFNPDNFSEEAVESRDPFAYKPFGNGQRACIGRVFAIQEATLIMGLILQRYELFLPKHYDLEIQESLSIKPKDFNVRIKKRSVSQAYSNTRSESRETVSSTKEQSHKVSDVSGSGMVLNVFYASNLGLSSDFASQIASDGSASGFKTIIKPLDESIEDFKNKENAVIVASTYNGHPPDNGKKFKSWLNDQSGTPLSGLSFAVFGCGNSQWHQTFQAYPSFIRERLIALGASEFHEAGRGDADKDIELAFEEWYKPFWEKIPGVSQKVEAEVAESTEAVLFNLSEKPAYELEVLSNEELINDPKASTRHIEVLLPEGATYRAGDYLAVTPKNSKQNIRRFKDRFNADLSSEVTVSQNGKKIKMTFETLLENGVEFSQTITRRQLRSLAEKTECPPEKKELMLLASEGYNDKIVKNQVSLLDVLLKYPSIELTPQEAVKIFPSLKPRFYSISSSNYVDNKKCTLTVGVVRKIVDSTLAKEGVCSTYLSRLSAGEKLKADIKVSPHNFYLPRKMNAPVIMVGAGTGIAPFRGFLQERLAMAKKTGESGEKMMLFFGCRHPEKDFLYEREMHQFKDVCELVTAFSRIEGKSSYVQDEIKAHQEKVWEKLKSNNAYVFICGSTKMANAVENTIAGIYKENNEEKGFERMQAESRFLTDIWINS